MEPSILNESSADYRVGDLLPALAARVVSTNDGVYSEITNVMTGRPLGRVAHCGPADVAAAAQRDVVGTVAGAAATIAGAVVPGPASALVPIAITAAG